jgi:ABC-type polysaccharide/polyol phosphate export permease
MTLTVLLLVLLLAITMLGIGGGVAALLLRFRDWSTPVVGALTAMMLMTTVVGVLVAAARS